MTQAFDVIVVGLGAVGSAATYQLSKRGQRVLGLDMFALGHDQGSSHGEHRMIRRSSFREDGYIPLANRAFELWDELEQESSESIVKILGEVRASYQELDNQLGVTRAMIEADPYRELLDETTLAKTFPGFRLHEGMWATYEADAGYLRPEVGIAAHLEVAARYGATIERPVEVTNWAVDGAGVRVDTSDASYTADRLVVTTGPWAHELLGDLQLPLHVVRIVNGYFEPTRPEYWRAENGAPNFLLGVPEGGFYGMPADGETGLKIGLHNPEGTTTARTIEREIDAEEIEFLRRVLDRYMPGASGPVLKQITCMYTHTADDDFIVERHPEYQQVVYGCGFSGRGYKFAPTTGEILADLAIGGSTRHDVQFLNSRRFVGVSAD